MLANPTTGLLLCEDCGADLTDANGPTTLERGGWGLLCHPCQRKSEGYNEGTQDSARELLEFAVLMARRELEQDEVRALVKRLLAGEEAMYIDVRI